MKLFNPGWFAIAAMTLGACAQAVGVGNKGSGGSAGSEQTGGGGAGGGASQSSGTGTPGCTMASDCTAMTDACNTGTCINGVCGKMPANDLGSCDDGLACTENDTCQGGVCTGGTTKFCPATDSCSIGSCDLMLDACVQVPGNDGAPCNDDDACTLPGSCSAGVCTPGGMVDCSFLDGTCSLGYCDPTIGCKVMPQADGAPCDDNLYCTVNDVCTAGQCAGIPNTCAAPGDVCMIGTCNEQMKTCVAVPGNDGAACSDNNACTTGETCSNGLCAGGAPANDGMACDDGNACTGGTTCANGVCGSPTSTIVQCINADMCCPPGCPNDSDCLYWASGVLQNVAPATLTGWTQCYTDTYNVDMGGVVQSIVQSCSKAKLLLACKPVNAANYTLAAMAPRVDALFDCGFQENCTHQSNGVGWYFNANWSWGFANAGDPVQRNECDVLAGPLRLCWHTINGAGGYRCGDNTGLNDDSTWKRVVYHAD